MFKNKIILTFVIALGIGFLFAPLASSAATTEDWKCVCDNKESGPIFPDFDTCYNLCGLSCENLGYGGTKGPSCEKTTSAPTPAKPSAPSGGGQTKAVSLDNPLGKDATVQTLIGRAISAVLGIVGSIALLMFIYGGFLWLTARGNDQSVQKGKDVLTWATIGLAVIFLSYTLVSFVIKGLTKGGTSGGGGGGAPSEQQKE